MPRKKVEEIVYCDSMTCKDTSCLRNKANTPWGVLVKWQNLHPIKMENVKIKWRSN